MSEKEQKKGSQEVKVCTPDDPQESHEKKLKRYAQAKTRSLAVSSYILDDPNTTSKEFVTGNRIASCGSYLVFHYFYTLGEYQLHQTSFCKKHLLCALCSIRRAAKQLRAYLEKADIVLADNPESKLIFGTLTVKNGDDLAERLHHLQNNYRKMVERRRNFLKGKTTDTVFKFFDGLVGTFEITNTGKGWHPHAHFIALVDKNYDCKLGMVALKSEWEKLTIDSHQCDLREFTGDDKIKAFVEVFKYALKTNDMTIPDQVQASRILKGKRLIYSFGAFFGVKVPEDLNDIKTVEMEDLPYIEMIYKYSDTYGYQLHEQNEKYPDPLTKKYSKKNNSDKKKTKVGKLLHSKALTQSEKKYQELVECYVAKSNFYSD